MDKNLLEIKQQCENSLKIYAQWVLPDRYFGDVHMDMFDFFQYGEADSKLVLVPRDHQKSVCVAILASWLITLDPSTTINYVSYNSDLVEKQLAFIKNILRSERHRLLWPDLLNWVKERGELKHKPTDIWQNVKFTVDHPDAKKSADPTVRAGTVRGTNTGMHSKVNIFDDLVTDENWKSDADKSETLSCYENFSKIISTGGKTYAVGTRYSPDDLYAHIMEEEAIWIDPESGEEQRLKLWSKFESVVEDSFNKDGTGNYCWPRQQMPDGSWYGFDAKELAIKKAKLSKNGLTNFYAQYYNDPNDESTNVLKSDSFQYINPKNLTNENGIFFYNGKQLKIYAATDLAWTDSSSKHAKRRDFTAIAVIGIDHEGYIYVLDLDRFQTDKPDVYLERIMDMHNYWDFKELYLETNSAGIFVKKYLQDELRRRGDTLTIEGKSHVSHQGKKEERIGQVLHPRYAQGTIYHNKGRYTRLLEEELRLARPPHDDLKDAVAMAIARAVAPRRAEYKSSRSNNVVSLSRFGGKRRNRRA